MAHYEDVRLESVENGYILKYTECRKNGHGTFSEDIREWKEMVFEDDNLDKAVEKMKEFKAANKKKGDY